MWCVALRCAAPRRAVPCRGVCVFLVGRCVPFFEKNPAGRRRRIRAQAQAKAHAGWRTVLMAHGAAHTHTHTHATVEKLSCSCSCGRLRKASLSSLFRVPGPNPSPLYPLFSKQDRLTGQSVSLVPIIVRPTASRVRE